MKASERELEPLVSFKLHLGDCLEVMEEFPGESIDAVIAELPVSGTGLRNRRDSVIPIDKLWKSLDRITHEDAPVIFISKQPFTSYLVMSNQRNFRHCWICEGMTAVSRVDTKYGPILTHEDISVFGKHRGYYSSQYLKRDAIDFDVAAGPLELTEKDLMAKYDNLRPASSVQRFRYPMKKYQKATFGRKPQKLLRFLVRSYAPRHGTILDFCMGTGATIAAAQSMHRNSIGIEINEEMFNEARKFTNEYR